MDKDTKVIFILLAIIAILTGVFIWKVVTPKEETIEISRDTNKDIEQILTDNDDLVEENYDDELENAAMILYLAGTLEENEEVIKFQRPIFIVVLSITIIIIAVNLKNASLGDLIRKKGIIPLIVITIILGVNTIKITFVNNAIEYAIENESWYIEKDTIKRITRDDNITNVYLKKHGKIPIRSFFRIYSEGDEVEVLMVEGKFGGEYEIGIR